MKYAPPHPFHLNFHSMLEHGEYYRDLPEATIPTCISPEGGTKPEAFRVHGTNPRTKEEEHSCVLGSPKGQMLLHTRVRCSLASPCLTAVLAPVPEVLTLVAPTASGAVQRAQEADRSHSLAEGGNQTP